WAVARSGGDGAWQQAEQTWSRHHAIAAERGSGGYRPLLTASAYARLQAQSATMPVIEQAKGILMAQHGCGPNEAFDLLRRASQRFNVPVRVLAARLVHGV